MNTVCVTHTSPGHQGPFEVVVGFDGAGQYLRGGDFLRLDLHDGALGSILGLHDGALGSILGLRAPAPALGPAT
jgi:hypothetical protein